MEQVKYYSKEALEVLRHDVDANIDEYVHATSYVFEYLKNKSIDPYVIDSRTIEYPDLLDTDENDSRKWEKDFENSKRLYNAIVLEAKLPFFLYSDQRYIAYLTHEVYWNHVCKRWPIKTEKDKNRILERYFYYKEPRSRNEILRLLWIPLLSYDADNEEDPFHLTKIAFQFNQTVDRLLDRELSKNPKLIQAILSAFEKNPKGVAVNSNGMTNKLFGTTINNYLGLVYLDAFKLSNLENIFSQKIDELYDRYLK